MEQPKGFKVSSSNKVYHLLHALYGLKQATLAWNKELHKSLLKLSFKHSKSNPGVYYYQDKSGIMLFIVYIDNGLLMSNSATLLKKKKTTFLKVWEARDMGPVTEYLGFKLYTIAQSEPWFYTNSLTSKMLSNVLNSNKSNLPKLHYLLDTIQRKHLLITMHHHQHDRNTSQSLDHFYL